MSFNCVVISNVCLTDPLPVLMQYSFRSFISIYCFCDRVITIFWVSFVPFSLQSAESFYFCVVTIPNTRLHNQSGSNLSQFSVSVVVYCFVRYNRHVLCSFWFFILCLCPRCIVNPFFVFKCMRHGTHEYKVRRQFRHNITMITDKLQSYKR